MSFMELWDHCGEVLRLRIMIGVAISFVVSTVWTCVDLKYAMFGEEATAVVYRVNDLKPLTRNPDDPDLMVHLRFSDVEGVEHEVVKQMPPTWAPPPDGQWDIEYLPGHKIAVREPGAWNYRAIGFFTVTVVVGLLVIAGIVREAYDH